MKQDNTQEVQTTDIDRAYASAFMQHKQTTSTQLAGMLLKCSTVIVVTIFIILWALPQILQTVEIIAAGSSSR
jgi:hypothetical protein